MSRCVGLFERRLKELADLCWTCCSPPLVSRATRSAWPPFSISCVVRSRVTLVASQSPLITSLPPPASNNPQTYHQALLLLAQLGPLVPEQLVHNVMPIFTFMGANVLQRDDAYSLRVVEKTLESIVPALVKSTKRSSADREALVSDLKELLGVFADAAAHVPRHRRIKYVFCRPARRQRIC